MIDFKKDFNQFLEDKKSLSLVSNYSFEYYLENYAKTASTFPLNQILTGNIYTFFYQREIKKNEEFLNNRPVVFFIKAEKEQSRMIISGIDLAVMFPPERVNFLARICEIFQKHLIYNLDPMNTPMSLPIEYKDLALYMKGIKYTHAFKKYSVEKIKNFHEITYPKWKYIPYLDTRSMQGISLSEIYKRTN
jgi:hypothetical protein